MPTTFKISCQICLHNIPSHLITDESSWQCQNICIVMLAGKLSKLDIPAQSCSHMRMMVCRHLGTVATSAKYDSEWIFSILDILRQRMYHIRIIYAFRRIAAVIFHRPAIITIRSLRHSRRLIFQSVLLIPTR